MNTAQTMLTNGGENLKVASPGFSLQVQFQQVLTVSCSVRFQNNAVGKDGTS